MGVILTTTGVMARDFESGNSSLFMVAEYQIVQVRRGGVWAQPLDGAEQQLLKLANASKYVENEIVVVEPVASESGTLPRFRVIASRIDPSYIAGSAPTVKRHGDDGEYEFDECVNDEEGERLDDALEIFRAGDYEDAGRLLRLFVSEHPYHIDAYHHLGIIETDLGHVEKALKYFETGYRIGNLSIPPLFFGTLPWGILSNRPFLRAAHGFGLALEGKRRYLEAVEVYERILALNPNDNLGVRQLLPSLLLKAQCPERAKAVLEQHGADGMNLFTRSLLEIQQGHDIEAVRWFCRGLSYNLHLPQLVLSDLPLPSKVLARYVTMGSDTEAADYLHSHKEWLKPRPREFLSRIMAMSMLASRWQRAFELKSLLDSRDGMPIGNQRSQLVNELFDIFEDKHIPQILEECRKLTQN